MRSASVSPSTSSITIAAIYHVEDGGQTPAIVMELVEGETLADRIGRGRIPVDEALPIAKQVAEALEAAHEQGIIHRDLKPANIKVRPDGTVKVLDFGLAKLAESTAAAVSNPSMSMSPTITSPALVSGVGVLLGTAAYMAPEQAKGRPADKRCDIWAFGCVLFEMLTGKRAFEGDDVADTLASVLKTPPPWNALPVDLHPSIAALLMQCLEKDRGQRIGDIAAALFAFRAAILMGHRVVSVQASRSRAIVILAIAVVVTAVIAGATVWRLKPSPRSPTTRFEMLLPPGEQFAPSAASRRLIGASPDGSQIAYVANSGLYVRSLTSRDAIRLVSSQDVRGIQNPVFSPDGQSIAFYSVVDQTVKRVAVTGGTAATVWSGDATNGMNWTEDGIVFGTARAGVMRLDPDGRQPENLLRVRPGEFVVQPQLLPGGRSVLFTLADSSGALDFDRSRIVVQSLDSTERKVVIDGGSDARYLPSGHIVYARGGILWAVPFDLARLQVIGGPVSMVEGVARGIGVVGLATAQFTVSDSGTLAYVPGPASISGARRELVSIDAQGVLTRLPAPAGPYVSPRVAPDGSKLAVVIDGGKDVNIWIYDLTTSGSLRRLTFEGRNRFPVWPRDGRHLILQSDRGGDRAIWWQLADGSAPAERLTTAPQGVAHIPEAWLGDDSFSYSSAVGGAAGSSDASLQTFSLTNKKAEPFDGVRSITQLDSAASPDGRWIAYTVRGAGAAEIFVQPLPPTGARYQVTGQGHHPLWSPDGHTLYFFPGGDRLLSVRVVTSPAFSASAPEPVPGGFTSNTSSDSGRNHDVTPDGRIVAALSSVEIDGSSGGQHIEVVLNWTDELKARVPTK